MTSKAVLGIAQKELGIKESPPNSNKVKYNTWFYGREVCGISYPWCMVFVQWVFNKAGVPLPAKTASCGELMRAAKKMGAWVTKNLQPGDVVIYDFPGGANTDHCGIIERVTNSGVIAIEGNTSRAGSQSNGGEVCRKTRPYCQIIGAVRPEYQKEKTRMDNTPSAAHKEAVEWAVKQKILNGNANGELMLSQPITRQQMCTMLYRFAKLLEKDR